MKLKRAFGVALSAGLIAAIITVAAAAAPDTWAYGFQAGKADRAAAPPSAYAGMDYEGDEQGDTSAYGYLAGKSGRTGEVAPYAGMNFEGGEQGDTSTYSYQTGRIGKPWNTAG